MTASGMGDFDFGYYPLLLQLGLTYRCNLKCPHCYALFHRTRDELSCDEVKRLIDDASALGAFKVVYSHGENLMRSDFHEIASYISQSGFFQTLMANGYYLRREDQISRLAATGINKVMISIDSSVPEEHNANRGMESSYDVAIGAIERLRRHSDISVGISMAISERNHGRVRDVAQLGATLGVDFISFMQIRPNRPGTFADYDWSTYDDVCRDLYEMILEYRDRIDVYTHDPFMITLMDDRMGDATAREDFIAHNQCNVGKYMMSICPNGDVTGCNFIDRVVGNLREEPLTDIWDRLVEDYDDSHMKSGPCVGCSARHSCRTGCKAFHLPFEDRYDRRCEHERFVEWSPSGVTV